jgi:hypothetical protein
VYLQEYEEFMQALHDASMEERITWQRVCMEDEPERDIYQTTIDGDVLDIEFSSVPLLPQVPPGQIEYVVSYALVTISGMKLWIDAASGTRIFALAKSCVGGPQQAKYDEKNTRAIKRATERVKSFR